MYIKHHTWCVGRKAESQATAAGELVGGSEASSGSSWEGLEPSTYLGEDEVDVG